MGLLLSTSNKSNKKKHYTSDEIKQNIDNLFIGDNIDVTSLESLNWNTENYLDKQNGGYLGALSESSTDSKKRYKKYDIKPILPKIQEGGNVNKVLNEINSDNVPDYDDQSSEALSVFENIKKHMLNELNENNNNQTGGGDDMSNSDSYDSIQPQLALLNMMGGKSQTTNSSETEIYVTASSNSNSDSDSDSKEEMASYSFTSNDESSVDIKPFSSTDTADYAFRHPNHVNKLMD
jgi:hypothetical protein